MDGAFMIFVLVHEFSSIFFNLPAPQQQTSFIFTLFSLDINENLAISIVYLVYTLRVFEIPF